MGGVAPELEAESLETEYRVDLQSDKNMRRPFPSAKTQIATEWFMDALRVTEGLVEGLVEGRRSVL